MRDILQDVGEGICHAVAGFGMVPAVRCFNAAATQSVGFVILPFAVAAMVWLLARSRA